MNECGFLLKAICYPKCCKQLKGLREILSTEKPFFLHYLLGILLTSHCVCIVPVRQFQLAPAHSEDSSINQAYFFFFSSQLPGHSEFR